MKNKPAPRVRQFLTTLLIAGTLLSVFAVQLGLTYDVALAYTVFYAQGVYSTSGTVDNPNEALGTGEGDCGESSSTVATVHYNSEMIVDFGGIITNVESLRITGHLRQGSFVSVWVSANRADWTLVIEHSSYGWIQECSQNSANNLGSVRYVKLATVDGACDSDGPSTCAWYIDSVEIWGGSLEPTPAAPPTSVFDPCLINPPLPTATPGPLTPTPTITPTPEATETPTPTAIPPGTPIFTPEEGAQEYLCNGSFEQRLGFWQFSGNVSIASKHDLIPNPDDAYQAELRGDTNLFSLEWMGEAEIWQYPRGGVIPPDAQLSFWAATPLFGGSITAGLGTDMQIICVFPTNATNSWVQFHCDLSAYAGRSDPVIIRLTGNALQSSYIDYVSLTSTGGVPDLKEGMNDDTYEGFVYTGFSNSSGASAVHASTNISDTVHFTTFNMKCMDVGYITDSSAGKLALHDLTVTDTVVSTIDEYSADFADGVETSYCVDAAHASGRRTWELQMATPPNASSSGRAVNFDYIRVHSRFGVLGPGIWDDADEHILYVGNDGTLVGPPIGWKNTFATAAYSGAYHKAVEVSAYAEFGILDVTCIGFQYWKGPDRGKLELFIDGSSFAVIDEYGPQVTTGYWQQCGLTAELHDVQLRPKGEKNAESLGEWVSVDYISLDNRGTHYLPLGITDDSETAYFTYANDWTTASAPPELYGGTWHRTDTATTNSSITFLIRNAICFKIVYVTDSDMGNVAVKVNGSTVVTLDMYSASYTYDPDTTSYENCSLSATVVNTIELVGAGSKNTSSSGYDFVLDYVEVHNGTSPLIVGRVDDTYRGLIYTGDWLTRTTTRKDDWQRNNSWFQGTLHVVGSPNAKVSFQTTAACISFGYSAWPQGGKAILTVSNNAVATVDLYSSGTRATEYDWCHDDPYNSPGTVYTATITFTGTANPLVTGTSQLNVDWVETKTYTYNSSVDGKYDDTADFIVYQGAWEIAHETALHEGAERRSNIYNYPARVQWLARARCVQVGYSAAPDRGIAQLYVDGSKLADIDQYATVYMPQQTFSNCNLRDQFHTFELRMPNADNRSPGAINARMSLDFIVFGNEAQIATAVAGSSQAYDASCSRPALAANIPAWLEYKWCQFLAWVTPNDYNMQQMGALIAYLYTKEPVGYLIEIEAGLVAFIKNLTTYPWTFTGGDQTIKDSNTWFGLLTKYNQLYKNGHIQFEAVTGYDVACPFSMPDIWGGWFFKGTCWGLDFMKDNGITFLVNMVVGITCLLAVLRYFVIAWVDKAKS